jgi:hypothetical protein
MASVQKTSSAVLRAVYMKAAGFWDRTFGSLVHCYQRFPRRVSQGVRSWSSSCGRQSVDQFFWVSGLPLGSITRCYLSLLFSFDNYFILLPKASSLTRKRVCSLQWNHSLVRLLTPNNRILASHLRLCFLFVAFTTRRAAVEVF